MTDKQPHNSKAQPIYRLLALGFLLMAIVPIGILSINLYQAAWDDAWREIREKHQLLATNLAAPIRIYVEDHKAMLGLLASEIRQPPDNLVINAHLKNTLSHYTGFQSLALVGIDGRLRTYALNNDAITPLSDSLFANETYFIKTRASGNVTISDIKPSPVNGQPTIIIAQPVKNAAGEISSVLLGELRIDLIEELRKKIKFGKKGHSAIVDKRGHVIAHPNPAWMAEMRDLSKLKIVQKMMAGKTGVTEFYSPFVKLDMVAGYASVPGLGWGIMVPQPKSEVEEQTWLLLSSHIRWGLLGLGLAIILGILLVRWITRPINQLASAAESLAKNNFEGKLPEPPVSAPREIQLLNNELSKLIRGFQKSRDKVNELNTNLQARVNEATSKLRQANEMLAELSKTDHLTLLANRRHFETSLRNNLQRRETDTESVSLMLIDIDKFKQINDTYGHSAGDAVLVQLGQLLKEMLRPADLVARYGGDEFIIDLHCDKETALKRSQEILLSIREHTFIWKDKKIRATVSIGLLYCNIGTEMEYEHIFQKVDMAMYEAKKRGRNNVVDIAA